MASQPVGGWLAAIIGLSFYVRRWIGNQTWRKLHRLTGAVYVMSLAHTLGSGSDARSVWLLYIVFVTAAPILFLTVFRVLPAKRPVKPARSPRAAAQRPAGLSPEAVP